jgi:arylsulfatase A-like enzyme
MGDWADRDTVKRSGYRYDSSEGSVDPELMKQAQIGYYACLTHLDHQIGRILQALEQEGILNDTIILFCSDHGELLGDHHTFRKTRPYQGSVHVPLFFRIPGEKGGVRYGTAACLEDIMPTLIELAGGIVQGAVTSKTRYLIAGANVGAAKTNKARQLGTEVIDEARLLELLK